MIYLVENNFSRGDSYNDSIDSAWSSLELAEAWIAEIKRQIEWFWNDGRVSFSEANEKQKKVIKKWSPMIGWDYDKSAIKAIKLALKNPQSVCGPRLTLPKER